jgi:hypothetical protein
VRGGREGGREREGEGKEVGEGKEGRREGRGRREGCREEGGRDVGRREGGREGRAHIPCSTRYLSLLMDAAFPESLYIPTTSSPTFSMCWVKCVKNLGTVVP